jgi:hypothetical protein
LQIAKLYQRIAEASLIPSVEFGKQMVGATSGEKLCPKTRVASLASVFLETAYSIVVVPDPGSGSRRENLFPGMTFS